jgi:hypothetical protein
MIDIESKVVESLHADADQLIKVDGLREAALARAGTLRRRRRALGALAGAGLVAVLTAGVVAVPRLAGGEGSRTAAGPPGDASAQAVATLPTTLPEAVGVPSAAEQPTAVGTDPGLLHFDVDLAPLKAFASDWKSAAGYERAVVTRRSNEMGTEIYLGRDAGQLETVRTPPVNGWFYFKDGKWNFTDGPRTPTTVNGRPGTLQRVTTGTGANTGIVWVLRWQPAEGLFALVQVFDKDQALAYAAAGALRLDRAQRCVTPLTLRSEPAGAKWTTCQTKVRRTPIAGRGVWIQSELTIEQPGGDRVSVWAEDAKRPRSSHDTGQFHPNRTVAGHPAQWRTSDPAGLWVLDFGPAEVFVGRPSDLSVAGSGRPQGPPLAERDAVRLAGSMWVAGDLARPELWPHRPWS